MKKIDKIQILSLLIIVLYLVAFALLLVARIDYGSGTSTMSRYILWPNGNDALKAFLKETIPNYKINAAVGTPLAILILGIITIATRLAHSNKCSILPLLLSGFLLYSTLNNSFMKLTNVYYGWVAVLAVIAVLSLIAFILTLIKKRKEKEFYIEQEIEKEEEYQHEREVALAEKAAREAEAAAEEAAEKAEEAAEKAEEVVEDAAEKAEEAAEDVAEKAEDAAEEIKDAIE